MKRRSHGLLVGSQSIIGQVTANGEPLVINDVTSQAGQLIHRPNPLLPLTAAEMGVPLKISERVIGALDVQASRLNAFGPEDVAVIQVLADQIAVAVDNARSYEVAQKAVEEIREADRLKSQFLANMSHELRTPLNSIIGFSRVILKGIDGPINDQQHQDLSAIYNSGQHLLGLINDVLDLSKIEAGKMELALEDGVVLADIVRGVMSTTIGLVRDKPIALHQELSPDLPRLRVDAMKIRQVLINLLSNAAKFTEQGSITVSARLRPLPGDDQQRQVIVSVIDTGPGIAEADQVKLFQPFSQVDGSLTRKTGGSGLGLSICQHFVQMHGGEIGLDSEVGKGTTFWFTLPAPPAEVENEPEEVKTVGIQDAPAPSSQPADSALAEQVQAEKPIEDKQPQDGNGAQDPAPAAPQTDQAQAQQSTDSAGPSQVGGVILAIDKDPQVVGLYRRYLASQAYTVIALNELDQAVTVAGGIMPRAITLDIAMQSKKETQFGILDGWQILKGLKVDPATRNIPIIVCSLAVDEEKAYRMGAGAVLLKPILEEDLTQALQRLLKQSTG
jgi:signal transduction histidine kinase/CheY-like chemotaxis protein